MRIDELDTYLMRLYEANEILERDYKRLHKRSKMHNVETAESYYRRWKERLIAEIRKTEKEIVENGQLTMNNEK